MRWSVLRRGKAGDHYPLWMAWWIVQTAVWLYLLLNVKVEPGYPPVLVIAFGLAWSVIFVYITWRGRPA